MPFLVELDRSTPTTYAERRARRDHLRDFDQKKLAEVDDPYVRCGSERPGGKVGSAGEILAKEHYCGHRRRCVVCGRIADVKDANDLQARVAGWKRRGGHAYLLTLTVGHDADDPFGLVWLQLAAGWKALTRGSAWQRLQRDFGIEGYTRWTEVVQSRTTGWHPHNHVVLFARHELDVGRLGELKTDASDRHIRGVEAAGGHANPAGQDIRPAREGIHRYLSKGSRIRSVSSSLATPWWDRRSSDDERRPFELLSDLDDAGFEHATEEYSLWSEYVETVRSTRHRMVQSSQGLDELTGAPSLDSYGGVTPPSARTTSRPSTQAVQPSMNGDVTKERAGRKPGVLAGAREAHRVDRAGDNSARARLNTDAPTAKSLGGRNTVCTPRTRRGAPARGGSGQPGSATTRPGRYGRASPAFPARPVPP